MPRDSVRRPEEEWPDYLPLPARLREFVSVPRSPGVGQEGVVRAHAESLGEDGCPRPPIWYVLPTPTYSHSRD